MILSALNAYYRRVAGTDDGPPLYGFDVAKVGGALHLDEEGRFLGILDLRVADTKGKARPRLMTVPRPPRRTVAIMPAFLCDNAGYLCGADSKGKPERAEAQFQASRDLHERLLGGVNHPAAKAILAHFAIWTPENAPGLLAPYVDLLDGWLVVKVHGQEEAFAHDVPALRDAWLAEVDAATSEARGQCLITGAEGVPLARLHPSVKGVVGAQSSGASLVSFNIESAVSYGKEQSFNAPVGEASAFGYAAALNHLLRRELGQARAVGDATVVVWGEKASAAETLLPDILDPFVAALSEAKASDADKLRAAQVRDALDEIVKGRAVPDILKPDASVRFFVLGLAPNAARLSVRFWWTDTLGHLLDNVGQHQRDLELVTDFPSRPPYPSLWALVNETRPKDADGKSIGGESSKSLHKLYGDLSFAALSGAPYPAALIPVLLARFRADGHVTHPRVALLKAILVRRWRLDGKKHKEIKMDLEEELLSVGDALGRVFALLEGLQHEAHDRKLNTSLRDKFIASASSTPLTVFPYLLQQIPVWKRKLARNKSKERLAFWFDSEIGRILADVGPIPEFLPLEERALFHIGYYKQRHRKKPGQGAETASDEILTEAMGD